MDGLVECVNISEGLMGEVMRSQCHRRARLAIVAPDPRHYRRSKADFPFIGLSEFTWPPLSHLSALAKESTKC